MEHNEMRLRVEYTGQLQSAVGRSEDRVELPDGATVSALLMHLGEKCGDHVRPHLLNPVGQIQRSLLVAINGTAHAASHAASTVLRHEDNVVLLPPIAGG